MNYKIFSLKKIGVKVHQQNILCFKIWSNWFCLLNYMNEQKVLIVQWDSCFDAIFGYLWSRKFSKLIIMQYLLLVLLFYIYMAMGENIHFSSYARRNFFFFVSKLDIITFGRPEELTENIKCCNFWTNWDICKIFDAYYSEWKSQSKNIHCHIKPRLKIFSCHYLF